MSIYKLVLLLSSLSITTFALNATLPTLYCQDTLIEYTNEVNDTQYFQFSVENGPENITFSTCGSQFDTIISLYYSDGTEIDDCDYYNGNTNENCRECPSGAFNELLFRTLDTGDYMLQIKNAVWYQWGKFRLSAICGNIPLTDYYTTTPAPFVIHDTLNCGDIITDYLHTDRDWDHYYKFTLNQADSVVFSNCYQSSDDSITKLDTVLALYDTNYTQIKFCDDGNNEVLGSCEFCPGFTSFDEGERMILSSLNAGEYFLKIMKQRGEASLSEPYRLSAECAQETAPMWEVISFAVQVSYGSCADSDDALDLRLLFDRDVLTCSVMPTEEGQWFECGLQWNETQQYLMQSRCYNCSDVSGYKLSLTLRNITDSSLDSVYINAFRINVQNNSDNSIAVYEWDTFCTDMEFDGGPLANGLCSLWSKPKLSYVCLDDNVCGGFTNVDIIFTNPMTNYSYETLATLDGFESNKTYQIQPEIDYNYTSIASLGFHVMDGCNLYKSVGEIWTSLEWDRDALQCNLLADQTGEWIMCGEENWSQHFPVLNYSLYEDMYQFTITVSTGDGLWIDGLRIVLNTEEGHQVELSWTKFCSNLYFPQGSFLYGNCTDPNMKEIAYFCLDGNGDTDAYGCDFEAVDIMLSYPVRDSQAIVTLRPTGFASPSPTVEPTEDFIRLIPMSFGVRIAESGLLTDTDLFFELHWGTDVVRCEMTVTVYSGEDNVWVICNTKDATVYEKYENCLPSPEYTMTIHSVNELYTDVNIDQLMVITTNETMVKWDTLCSSVLFQKVSFVSGDCVSWGVKQWSYIKADYDEDGTVASMNIEQFEFVLANTSYPSFIHNASYEALIQFSHITSDTPIACVNAPNSTDYIIVKSSEIDNTSSEVLIEKSWLNAQWYCDTMFGTSLATVATDSDIRKLLNTTLNITDRWVGLNDIYNQGIFYWIDGQSNTHTVTGTENCVSVFETSDNSLEFRSSDCSEEKQFICDGPSEDRKACADITDCWQIHSDCCGDFFNGFDSVLSINCSLIGVKWDLANNLESIGNNVTAVMTQNILDFWNIHYDTHTVFRILPEDFEVTIKEIAEYDITEIITDWAYVNGSIIKVVIDNLCYQRDEIQTCEQILHMIDGWWDEWQLDMSNNLSHVFGSNFEFKLEIPNDDYDNILDYIEYDCTRCLREAPNEDILSNPAIAFWDTQLFVFGAQFFYYTTFNASNANNEFDWVYVPLQLSDDRFGFSMQAQQYAQYKESLWLVGTFWPPDAWEPTSYLVHLDLETLNQTWIVFENSAFEFDAYPCLAADGNYVYTVTQQNVQIYDINNQTFQSTDAEHKFNHSIREPACALTIDYIYIFGGLWTDPNDESSSSDHFETNIIKYDTTTHNARQISTKIMYPFWSARAITAANGKIYLFDYKGNEDREYPGKYMVFDPATERFEPRLIGIDYTISYNAQLAIYSDNRLLFWTSSNGIFWDTIDINFIPLPGVSNLYSLVTDQRVINFEETTQSVWASDGFILSYHISEDFSGLAHIGPLWNISFYCDDMDNVTVSVAVYINAQSNNCIKMCEEMNENNTCFDCDNGVFPLNSYLEPMHGNIDSVNFYVSSHAMNSMVILPLPQTPQYVTISLKRCHVILTNATELLLDEKQNKDVPIDFELSQECYSYDAIETADFSMEIEIFYELWPELGTIIKTLTIDILDAEKEKYESRICDSENCKKYTKMQFTIEPAETGPLTISFAPLIIDLAIDGQSEFVVGLLVDNAKAVTDYATIGITGGGSLGALLLIVILIIFGRRYYYKSKEAFISNPLVVLIGVGYYEAEPTDPEFIVEEIPDLCGVEKDMEMMVDLFEGNFNYTVVGNQDRDGFLIVYREHTSIYKLLEASAKLFLSEQSSFDSLIVVVTGHSVDGSIVTSDWKLIDKDVIHRYYSVNYPKIREFPRLVILDLCSSLNESKDLQILDNIERQGPLLADYGNDPDINLAQIEAGNTSYQSKMDLETGSYLIAQFVSEMEQFSNEKTLGNMCDSIAKDLETTSHVRAEEQSFKSAFNNSGAYLRFNRNSSVNKAPQIEGEGIEMALTEGAKTTTSFATMTQLRSVDTMATIGGGEFGMSHQRFSTADLGRMGTTTLKSVIVSAAYEAKEKEAKGEELINQSVSGYLGRMGTATLKSIIVEKEENEPKQSLLKVSKEADTPEIVFSISPKVSPSDGNGKNAYEVSISTKVSPSDGIENENAYAAKIDQIDENEIDDLMDMIDEISEHEDKGHLE